MAQVTVKPRKLADAPEWIFRWRGSRQPLLPRLFALALAGGAFTFLVSVVKIRVDSPDKTALRRGSVIYLQDDQQGRALALRASEGGPFPSRFELSQWQGLPDLEAAVLDAVRYQAPAYVPTIQDLPETNLVRPLQLAARGESFFPERRPLPVGAPDIGEMKVAPILYPLSGVTAETLPKDLPAFTAVVDGSMSSASWRFLLRLNADGSVAECVSMEKGGEQGAAELERWLQRILFTPDLTKATRWISVGVGFTNQPADGTNPR